MGSGPKLTCGCSSPLVGCTSSQSGIGACSAPPCGLAQTWKLAQLWPTLETVTVPPAWSTCSRVYMCSSCIIFTGPLVKMVLSHDGQEHLHPNCGYEQRRNSLQCSRHTDCTTSTLQQPTTSVAWQSRCVGKWTVKMEPVLGYKKHVLYLMQLYQPRRQAQPGTVRLHRGKHLCQEPRRQPAQCITRSAPARRFPAHLRCAAEHLQPTTADMAAVVGPSCTVSQAMDDASLNVVEGGHRSQCERECGAYVRAAQKSAPACVRGSQVWQHNVQQRTHGLVVGLHHIHACAVRLRLHEYLGG